MTVPTYIENAAYEAHMAAVDSIKASGIRNGKPDIKIVTNALAHAYGDALGLLAMSGADSEVFDQMNLTWRTAMQDMICKIQMKDCAGSA